MSTGKIKKAFSVVLSALLLLESAYATDPTSTTQQVSNDILNASPNSGGPTVNQYLNSLDASSLGGKNTKLSHPLYNLLGSVEWPLFLKEFEISLKAGVCCPDDNFLHCAIGFKAHMIEPIGFFETSQTPFYFPFADISLGNTMESMIKGNSLHRLDDQDMNPRHVSAYAHFIFLPIFGLIFKKKLRFACFHPGDMSIPYMSEFDPTWKVDVYYSKLVPHMVTMFTPTSIMSGLFDCIATETVNAVNGYSSGTVNLSDPQNGDQVLEAYREAGDHREAEFQGGFKGKSVEFLNSIRDTMYFIDGCNGFGPIGGYVNGNDPIAEATLTWYGIMAMLHGVSAFSPIPFLEKQVNMVINQGAFNTRVGISTANVDTMCEPKKFPLPIASQYLLQLAYPVVGSAKECGAAPPEVSTLKNVPGAANSSVFYVWERRDYYAFAYKCYPEEDKEITAEGN